MATHSSTLAWKIPWTEEPSGLQSMGSWRVGRDWATSLSLFTFMHWRRKWQPTPVFLPGESQGRGSLLGCHLWGRTESDTTVMTGAAAATSLNCLRASYLNLCFQSPFSFSPPLSTNLLVILHIVTKSIIWKTFLWLCCCCCYRVSRVRLCATP